MMYVRLFCIVLEISIKSSVLIGAILLIKNIFGEKMGAKNQYFLWFLLIIRLILPNINLKFFNIFSKINPYNNILRPNYIITKVEVISWFNNVFSQQDFNTYNNFTLFSLNHLLPNIWLLGMLILILYLIISNIKYRLSSGFSWFITFTSKSFELSVTTPTTVANFSKNISSKKLYTRTEKVNDISKIKINNPIL